MGKTFDDLFNDFFNNRKKTYATVNEELRKIIDSLMSFKKIENKVIDETIQQELGEPDQIIDHVENGMNFRKMIWNTPLGKFVQIVVTDVNSNEEPKEEEDIFKRRKHSKSLEQRLKEAVEVEDYELAIKLRDEIKKNRKNARKKKSDK